MKLWRKYILLFIATYLVSLVMTFPAALAWRWAQPALARSAQLPELHGIEGTLWSGHASEAVYHGMPLGELQWDISPWALFVGYVKATLKVKNADGYLNSEVSSGFSGKSLQLNSMTGQLPASLIKNLAPSLPVVPTGNISINLEEAIVESSRVKSLKGRVVWNKGGIASPLALELGDLVAEFKGSNNSVSGNVHDSGGPLQLNAELKFGNDGSYTFTGTGAARTGASPALVTSLSLLGQADAQGKVQFHFNGHL